MQKPYGATLKYFFIIILWLLNTENTRGHSWSLECTFRQDPAWIHISKAFLRRTGKLHIKHKFLWSDFIFKSNTARRIYHIMYTVSVN
jgi:hypothetical protein